MGAAGRRAALSGSPAVDVVEGAPLPDLDPGRPVVALVRGGHRYAWVLAGLTTLARRRPDLVVVELGSPGPDRLPGRTLVHTYGASAVSAQALDDRLADAALAGSPPGDPSAGWRGGLTVEVVVLETEQERADLVADAVVALVEAGPTAVLGLATGSSPSPVYAELVRRFEAGEVSFAAASAFTLDEYLGLPPGHGEGAPGHRARVRLPRRPAGRPPAYADGQTNDVPAACAAYERAIAAAGGVDLQLLGIGSDGHLAFNEPGSSLASRTRVKTLTPGPAPTTRGS